MTPTALILAGGFATRLWPLTEKRAKPLLPLAGKTLISHIIATIPVRIPIIISTNQQFKESFESLKNAHSDRKIDIFIEDSHSDQTKKGALAATALVIEEFKLDHPLLLIAGDNYFGFDMQHFLSAYRGKTLLASFDTKSLQQAKQFGVVEVKNGRLIGFVEKPSDPRSTLISTGCYLFSPADLPSIQAYAHIANDNLGGIFEFLLEKAQEIEVYSFEEDWVDIGSFASYLDAHRLLMPENQISGDSRLENTDIGRAVQVGKGCSIKNSSLNEVIIMENCEITDANLRGCIIDENCQISGVDLNHKMIRAGSIIRG